MIIIEAIIKTEIDYCFMITLESVNESTLNTYIQIHTSTHIQ